MFATLKSLRLPSARPTPPSRRNRRFDLKPRSESLETRDLMAVGLDPTFGLAGAAQVATFPRMPNMSVGDNLTNIAMQADGKILGVGSRYVSTYTDSSSSYRTDTVIERFNPDGTLDATFGVGGAATYTAMSGTSALDGNGVGIVVQPDGKIVVLSSTSQREGSSTSVNDFAVARFNSNGTIDTSFNGTGYLLIDFTPSTTSGNVSDTARGIAIAPGGKVVVVGSTFTPPVLSGGVFTGGSQDMAVALVGADGKLDPTFGTGGKTVIAFDAGGSKSDTANDVAVDALGRIVVVGNAAMPDLTVGTLTTSTTDIAVAVLSPGGVLDPTFGAGGKMIIAYDLGGNKRDTGTAVLIDGDKIVIGGTANLTTDITGSFFNPDVYQFTVTRLTMAGALDPTFAGTGKFASALPTTTATVGGSDVSLAKLSDSSLMVAGRAYLNSDYDSATFLANVLANGGLNTSYGKGGAALLPGVYTSGNIVVQPDGKILISTSSGVVRTTAPTPKVMKAELVTMGNGKKAKSRMIKLKFNTSLNANLANKKNGYQVRIGKRGKRFLEIRKVSYDPSTFETTILLKKPAPKKALQVMLSSLGIAGADDQLLNNGDDLAVDVAAATSASPVATKRHRKS